MLIKGLNASNEFFHWVMVLFFGLTSPVFDYKCAQKAFSYRESFAK